MELFGFLEGMSPWWWVAFGLSLGALEMATMSFFLIWPGLAAIVMAVVIALFPSMPGEIQVATFGVLAVALTFAGRSLFNRFGDNGEAASHLNSRSSQLIGRRGKIIRFAHGEGVIEIDGIHWQAKADPSLMGMSAGSVVQVKAAEGMLLEVTSQPGD